jgi:excisionase family DNA binding protein
LAESILLTPEQVAERLQVKERTVLDWLRAGDLRGLKLGRLWRVRPEDLEKFLAASVAPKPAPRKARESAPRKRVGATTRRRTRRPR